MSELKSYTISEFEKYVDDLRVSRNISLIQVHHTYSPSYKQFTGNNHITLQSNMRSYHIKTNGWSDIAQHFTIFPDGVIVTGRSMEMIPAGIKGANSGAICIECLGNFDRGGDTMKVSQKNAIAAVIRILADKFGIAPETGIVYHSWWTSDGKKIGDYNAAKSSKTCPGTNFFGGSSRSAFEKNLLPLITQYNSKKDSTQTLKCVESINDIIWELCNASIITDSNLWMKKCKEDNNVYWLCRKMANHLRGTL